MRSQMLAVFRFSQFVARIYAHKAHVLQVAEHGTWTEFVTNLLYVYPIA